MSEENERILRASLDNSQQKVTRLLLEIEQHNSTANAMACDLRRAESVVVPALAWYTLREQFQVAAETPPDQARYFPNTMKVIEAEKSLHGAIKRYMET